MFLFLLLEVLMTDFSQGELQKKKCLPCEGGLPSLTAGEAAMYLVGAPGWQLSHDGLRIRREWRVRNFTDAITFFHEVTKIAEEDGHHPDLHLTNYRNVCIELWTHAVGGLTENDFILAAKINSVEVPLNS